MLDWITKRGTPRSRVTPQTKPSRPRSTNTAARFRLTVDCMPNLKGPQETGSRRSSRPARSTKAMQMVAAAKLRRATGRRGDGPAPTPEKMVWVPFHVRVSPAPWATAKGAPPPLLWPGNRQDDVHLLVVMTAECGCCAAAFKLDHRAQGASACPVRFWAAARRSRGS